MGPRCSVCLEPTHTASWGGHLHDRTSMLKIYKTHSVTKDRFVSSYSSGSSSLDSQELPCTALLRRFDADEGPIQLQNVYVYEGCRWPTDVHFV